MKQRAWIVIAVIIVSAIAVVAVFAQAQKSARQVWECAEVELSETVSATPTLNKHGSEGWELVDVTSACKVITAGGQYSNPTAKCFWYAYFKRPK